MKDSLVRKRAIWQKFTYGSRMMLAILVALLTSLGAQAQADMIKGSVFDDTGEALIGATIMAEGKTGVGTVTDIDGNFTLKVKPGTKLRVTYVGYEPQTVTAQDGMRIVLKNSATTLNAVEVVAYGVQKKVTVTGAISSVKGDELVKTPVSSVNNVLAGTLTGVTTVQTSGEPGDDAATVYVRGQGTWNNSAPLIQVDGVERSMNDIDPEEIESITVLKDASATAVFGVRGANGVVLITTKRGKEGKPKIDISTSFSAVNPTKMIEQASSWEYATFHNMMKDNDGAPHTFSDEIVEKFRTGDDPIRFPSTRWSDYIMKKTTLQTKSNVNISGGTKDVRYFVSLGLMTQGGLFKEFDYDENFSYSYNRFNYRSNLDIDVTPTTKVSFDVSGIVSSDHKPRTSQGASGMIREMYQATPFSSPGIVDGRLVYAATDYTDGLVLPFIGGSGLTYINSAGTGGSYNNNLNKLQADLSLVQKLDFLTKGLSFRLKGSYNSQFSVQKGITISRATYTPVIQPDGSMLYRKTGSKGQRAYEEKSDKARDWYFEAAFNYNREFGLHNVGALLLYNQSKIYYPKAYSDIPSGYIGLVGRVTYNYDNKYMAEFNIGYNGSENFHPDRRFGTFPAGSIGWVVSNEKFWEPITPIVDFFKLRASWGLVGNDKVGGDRFMYLADPFSYNDKMAARGGYAYNFGINNGLLTPGYQESGKNNPEVTWEKAFKQDYGFDAYFLNQQLKFTFDYYKEHRTGILLRDMTAPSYIGFEVPYANLGIVDSHGFEFSLAWNQRLNENWRYWATLNLSTNSNKVIEMKESPQTNVYQYAAGHRIGARSMYKFFRFYDEETPALYEKTFGQPFPQQMTEMKPGDAVYVDLDGNGKIDADDMTRDLGYTDDPQWVAGLNMGVQFKNLELSMMWTGAWGVSRMISDVFRNPFLSRTGREDGGLLSYHLYHSWNAENPGQDYDYPRPSWNAWDNNYATSTLYEKDSKYLRLKTIQLAYTMDFPWVKKIGMRNMQVAFSGYNLLTFTPYIFGDPEATASASPSYPLQKTYTISLKLNF